MAEKAQAQYNLWRSESDVSKKAVLEKDLFDKLGTLIKRYPRQYGGQRGLFIRAEAYSDKKAWDDSLKDFETLAARFPKSYLAPISLFDAAVCYEEKGDTDSALKLYVSASSSYKESTVAPRALFDSGRLYEAKSEWTNAQKAYGSMEGLYAQSIWTRLAKNRLVELKVQGKSSRGGCRMAEKRAANKILETRYFGLVIGLLVFLLLFALSSGTVLVKSIEQKMLDINFRFKNSFSGTRVQEGVFVIQNNPRISPDILIVGIDDKARAEELTVDVW